MQVIEIEGLKGVDEFIDRLRVARKIYVEAKASGRKNIGFDWHAKPLPGGTPKKTRIEIKVTNE